MIRRRFIVDIRRCFSGKAKDYTEKPKLKLKKDEDAFKPMINAKFKRKSKDDEEKDDNPAKENRAEVEKYQKHAIFATKMGAVANVGLAFSKGLIGLSISSTALVADAANSLGDVLSDAVVYYSITEARKTATPDRPWGRGKIEPLGALSVGLLLLTTGVGIGFSAFLAAYPSMINPLSALELISPGDIIVDQIPALEGPVPVVEEEKKIINNVAALGISGISILAKEGLFRYTLNAGEKANSSAVIANAWQHRSDVSTSIAVFAGLIGSMLGYPILDPIAGMIVSGVIIKQAYIIGKDSLRDLSDAPAGQKDTDKLRQTVLSVNGVQMVEELQARKSGPFLFVEVTVGVDGSISASAAHRISELTRLELLNKHSGRVANAIVHVTPMGSSGLGESYPAWARDHEFIIEEVTRAVKKVKEVLEVSEVQVYYKDDGKISTKVDILLPANLTIKDAHAIAFKARKSIEEALPGIGSVDVDLELEE